MKPKKPFHGIIIETTGLADPAPVAQTFFVDEEISEKCVLDAIITVVDVHNIIARLDDKKPDGVENEAVEQVAFADKIILNKMDLVQDEKQIQDIIARLHTINSHAEIIKSTNSKVDPTLLFNIQGFNINRVLEKEPDFLTDVDSQQHQHDQSVTSVSFQHQDPVSLGDLQEWISNLIKEKGNDLFRYKGIINVKGMNEKFVFQGVHMLFNGDFGASWGAKETRFSRFVFIGRNLNHAELTSNFMKCKAPEILRFKIGDKVEANTGKHFEKGTVIKLWDDGNPYRIRLDRGVEVWGPSDVNQLVRPQSKK